MPPLLMPASHLDTYLSSSAPLLNNLTAGKAIGDGPHTWGATTYRGDLDGIPGSVLQPGAAGHCSHLGRQPADGRSLFLIVSVSVTQLYKFFFFQTKQL